MIWGSQNQFSLGRAGLDNFVVGQCNEIAFKAARIFTLPDFPSYYNPLLIIGRNGTGKTHLLKGIYRRLYQKYPHLSIKYTTASSFTKDYTYAIWQNKLKDFRKKHVSVNVLLIDDVHLLSGKKATQREFSQVFDTLVSRHKKIVLTSIRMPYQISKLSERLASRLNAGLSVKLAKPDYETKRSILSSIILHYRKRVKPKTLNLIARRVNTDLHDLLEIGRKVAECNVVTSDKTKEIIQSVLNAQ